MDIDFSSYDNSGYDPGAGLPKRALWYFVNATVFNTWWFPFSKLKRFLLRLFGAEIGCGVVIKPRVNIKYPWYLSIGNNSWIGEGVWIDNLCHVRIGSNCCLSQGVFILTGNHDYKSSNFSLFVSGVVVEDGVWIGARSTLCPGVLVMKNCVLTVGSVLTKDTIAGAVYGGHPATHIRERMGGSESFETPKL